MSKIAEQKIEDHSRHVLEANNPYNKGYDQAMQDFMEKACEWLKGNSKKYVVCYEDGYSHYACNSMIDDFKNYIQNESEK